ncbi:hypothetical protein ACWXVQ_00250 [Mycoplasma sp. 527]
MNTTVFYMLMMKLGIHDFLNQTTIRFLELMMLNITQTKKTETEYAAILP